MPSLSLELAEEPSSFAIQGHAGKLLHLLDPRLPVSAARSLSATSSHLLIVHGIQNLHDPVLGHTYRLPNAAFVQLWVPWL